MTKHDDTALPEQLTLLSVSEAPLQFRLDERTRRLGLANIAKIRRQLAERGIGVAPAASTAHPAATHRRAA